MASDKPKQYLTLYGKTILEHTINCFLSHPGFPSVLVAISPTDTFWPNLALANDSRVRAYFGAAERVGSVLNGLECLVGKAKDDDWVWVHDAARPCLSHVEIDALIRSLAHNEVGSLLAVPIVDTIKRADAQDRAALTVDRRGLWRAMTPQVFRFAQLRRALTSCLADEIQVTDDASAIEYCGGAPRLVSGSENNIKITRPHDLELAQQYMSNAMANYSVPRIGTGFDVHAFGMGDHITLGGTVIPHENGLIAHSDGDVLLHAIMDALLGALALGDIGKHFPDTELKWKNADSRELLKAVLKLVEAQGYRVGNVDSTIIAQAPRMAPYIDDMRQNIADDLGISATHVSVKATTTERLGFTGRKEGLACQATVLLIQKTVDAL